MLSELIPYDVIEGEELPYIKVELGSLPEQSAIESETYFSVSVGNE